MRMDFGLEGVVVDMALVRERETTRKNGLLQSKVEDHGMLNLGETVDTA